MHDGIHIGGAAPGSGTFARRFWSILLVGLLGIASLPLTVVPLLRVEDVPEEVADLPLWVVVGLSMVNPLLLLLAAAALGAALAPRLGLSSLIAECAVSGAGFRRALWDAAPGAVGIGALVALGTVAADVALQPLLPRDWVSAASATSAVGGWKAAITGVLYGGVTEEIMVRWAGVSVFAWLGWRLFQRRRDAPSAGIMWLAVALAAVAFGIGHLPAAAAVAPLDWAVILRTVFLNAVAGTVFGVLFWRRHLEAAMIAHATATVVATIATMASPFQPA